MIWESCARREVTLMCSKVILWNSISRIAPTPPKIAVISARIEDHRTLMNNVGPIPTHDAPVLWSDFGFYEACEASERDELEYVQLARTFFSAGNEPRTDRAVNSEIIRASFLFFRILKAWISLERTRSDRISSAMIRTGFLWLT